MKGTAYFVKTPSRIENLQRPHLPEEENTYKIAAEVTISQIDYGNFITDLRVERQFLEDNADLCSVDQDDVWHCLLIRQDGGSDGVLVMPDKNGHVIWAAYLLHTES
jgi:hypothetical protein